MSGRRFTPAFVAILVIALMPLGFPGSASHAPNDPLFKPDPPAIGLGQWGPRQIRAEEAWHTSTGAGTRIAIVDSGIDLDHEDLIGIGNVIPGITFLECPGNPAQGCGNGDWQSGPPSRLASSSTHGTHVAGISAAATNNLTGIAGTAPDAELLAVKVIDEEGGTSTDIARGIIWAVDVGGAEVINLSIGTVILGLLPGSQLLTILGGPGPIEDAIAYARSRGAVVVAASGNEFFALCTDPAFASEAICVTATDSNELPAEYANKPINEAFKSVAAPGGGIVDFTFFCGGGVLATVPPNTANQDIQSACKYPANRAYDEFTGTSMATPHVTGVAALLRSLNCDVVETENVITSTARHPVITQETGARGVFTPEYGFGIVDAAEAVSAASTGCGINDSPVAADDLAITTIDTPVTIGVLSNDADPEGDPLTITGITQPSNGSATLNGDGTVTYTPTLGFEGTDSFTYTISDPQGLADTATVTVIVQPPQGDACLAPGAKAVSDPEGDQLPVGTSQQDIHSVSVQGLLRSPSRLTFTMKVDNLEEPLPFNGIWRVAWASPDGVTYFVAMDNTDPTAGISFRYGVIQDSISSTLGPADSGSFSADGTITITIAAALVGASEGGDALTSINGETQLLIGSGLVGGALLTIDDTTTGSVSLGDCPFPPNNSPAALDDAFTVQPNSTARLNVIANDTDPDGDALSVTTLGLATHGTSVNNGDGTVSYTPNSGFAGDDSFIYSISDGRGGIATATVGVVVEDTCTLPGVTILTDGTGDSTGGRPEHDVQKLSISETDEFGVLKITFVLKMASLASPPPNTTWPVTFKDASGADRWVKMASDAAGAIRFAYGTGVNPSGAGTTADPSSNFSPGGTIQIVVPSSAVGDPQPGQTLTTFLTRIRVELASGAAVTPDNMPQNFTGAGAYVIQGNEICINLAPDAVDDSATTLRGNAVTIPVLANDSDPNGDPLAVTEVGSPSNGEVILNADGTITYTPESGFYGGDQFTYTVSDPEGLSDTATVRVSVFRIESPPIAVDDSASTFKKSPVTLNVLANDTDPDGDQLTLRSHTNGANGQVVCDSAGKCTYTPNVNFKGRDSFKYLVCDTTNLCDVGLVTVDVLRRD